MSSNKTRKLKRTQLEERSTTKERHFYKLCLEKPDENLISRAQKQDELKKKKIELGRSLGYKNMNEQARGEKKTKITTESINNSETSGNRKGKPEKNLKLTLHAR